MPRRAYLENFLNKQELDSEKSKKTNKRSILYNKKIKKQIRQNFSAMRLGNTKYRNKGYNELKQRNSSNEIPNFRKISNAASDIRVNSIINLANMASFTDLSKTQTNQRKSMSNIQKQRKKYLSRNASGVNISRRTRFSSTLRNTQNEERKSKINLRDSNSSFVVTQNSSEPPKVLNIKSNVQNQDLPDVFNIMDDKTRQLLHKIIFSRRFSN